MGRAGWLCFIVVGLLLLYGIGYIFADQVRTQTTIEIYVGAKCSSTRDGFYVCENGRIVGAREVKIVMERLGD